MLSKYVGLQTRRRLKNSLFFLADVPSAVAWVLVMGASMSLSVVEVVGGTEREERGGCAERRTTVIPNSSEPPSIHLHFSLRADTLSWIIHLFLRSPLLLISLAYLERKGTNS